MDFFSLLRDLSAAFTITFSVVTKTTKQHTTFRKQSVYSKFMYMLLIFFMFNLCHKSICRYKIVVPSTSRSPKVVSSDYKDIYFMVTPCINNTEPFLLPTDAHNVKKRSVIKTF